MTIEEFNGIELKIASIITAERVPNSEKLVKIKLSLGESERRVIAGIGKKYTPEELVGKQIVIVANLDPRTIMGEESQGMLLAAHDAEGAPVLLVPEKQVPSGSTIG